MSDLPQDCLDALEALRFSIAKASAHASLSELRKIDQHIQGTLTAALNNAYNTHAPVNKLPPELLGRIILLCQPHYDDFLPYWPSRRSLLWTAITRVCTHWRHIAIAFPALWSDDVSVLNDVATHHLARLTALHIVVERYEHFCKLCDFLKGSPQKLLSLSLRIRDSSRGRWIDGGCAVFGQHLPSVRKLTVSHCAAWRHNSFTNLSHFAAHECVDNASENTKFWHLLAGSPRLAVLVLDAYCVNCDQPGSESLILPLPHLGRLQFYNMGAPSTSALLHSFTNVPETCDVHISCEPAATDDDLVALLAPSSRCRLLQRAFHTVQLGAKSSSPTFRGRIAVLSGTLFVSGIDNFGCLAGVAGPDSRLVIVLDCWSETTTAAEWGRLLESMPKIRTLVVITSSSLGEAQVTAICDALCCLPDATKPQVPLCPALENLHFYTNWLLIHHDPWRLATSCAEWDAGTVDTVTFDCVGLPDSFKSKRTLDLADNMQRQIYIDAIPPYPAIGGNLGDSEAKGSGSIANP
ncbi:hypothetical protein K523DRAFT_395474 [Schizophyllum commune Tattone D]|nr:hypothetical protein K523DRAFT_395474 [Schizophyllum commune Tattone D]